MSTKQEKVSLPMASAGIIGFSSDVKISGIDLDPKMLIIAVTVFVILVKIADVVSTH